MSRKINNKRMLIINVVVLAVLVLGLGIWLSTKTQSPKPSVALERGTMLLPPVALERFNLVDDNGQPFTKNNLKGHWSLIFFGFTNCPMVCPTTLTELNKAYQSLKQANSKQMPTVIFISVDPERDTAKKIKTYLANFNPQFVGATGNKESIDKLTKNLGIMYAKAKKSNEENYDVSHSGTLLIINPEGDWAAILTSPHDGKTIARDFLKIQQYKP